MAPGDMRAALETQGFRITSWIDRTAAAVAWFAGLTQGQTPGPLGLHLVMGPDFPQMSANLARNLREGRAALVEAVMLRP